MTKNSIGKSDQKPTAKLNLSEAERFDPPLFRQVWETTKRRSWAAFVEDAKKRWQPGPEAFDQLLWHGGLQIDGQPLDPDAPPEDVKSGARVVGWGFEREPEVAEFDLPERILHDDQGLLALDKPAWWTMQRTRASVRPSLEDRLRRELDAPELMAVHRLDRQTTGVALFARDRESARRIQKGFGDSHVRKRYLARVSGDPEWWACLATGWWVRVADPSRFRFGLTQASEGPVGRRVEARFRVLERYGDEALIEAKPVTGRTHQLRIQLAALGHPILGDTLYGAEPDPGRIRLHAAELRFRWHGERLRLSAELPADFSLLRRET